MEIVFNYIFALMFPFGQDGWKVLSLVSIIFAFKYFAVWKRDKIVLSLFAFLLYGSILSLFSNDIFLSFIEMQKYFIGWLCPFLLGMLVIKKTHKIKILKTYIIIFLITIFFGLLAYFNIIPSKILYATFMDERLLAVLCWHTVFGGKCSFILIILFVLFLFGKNNNRYLYIFSIILFLFALLLSGTRACYISVFSVLSLIVIFCIYNKYKIGKVFFLVALSLGLFVTVYVFNPLLNNRINNTNINKDGSIIERIEIYKYGLNLLKEIRIFGFYPGCAVKSPKNINKLPHFHNIYLQIILDFGILGFVLFVILIFFIFRRLFYLYKKTKSPYFLMLIFAWCSVLISENFDCLLTNPFFSGQSFWITGLIIGGTEDDNSKNS